MPISRQVQSTLRTLIEDARPRMRRGGGISGFRILQATGSIARRHAVSPLPSYAGLTRVSIFHRNVFVMDGRVKPGHDAVARYHAARCKSSASARYDKASA